MNKELVVIEDGEEELIATGSEPKMLRLKDSLEADYREGGELEGDPTPSYRIQPAK